MPPTIPADLKPIAPFLQRAEETKVHNPIIAYWATYYALQIALALKFETKDNQRTLYLANMMDLLEQEKQRLAVHEAITQSSVSAAYVEDFALRVFTSADNEDRNGQSTRSTARKFLAAANFLELLKIFDPLPQEIEEKIKYSKWKAADISKAFREGRQPQPGPPSGDETLSSTISPPPSTLSPSIHPHSPPGSKTPSPNIPAAKLSTSPPSTSATLIDHRPASPSAAAQRSVTPKGTPTDPGLWSNTATPGGDMIDDASPIKRPTLANRLQKFSQDDDAWSNAADIGSRQNSYHNPSMQLGGQEEQDPREEISSSPLGTAFVPPNESSQPGKHVRWTPSVTGGSSTTGSPPASPESYHPTLDSLPEGQHEEGGSHDPRPSELDTFVVSQDPVYASAPAAPPPFLNVPVPPKKPHSAPQLQQLPQPSSSAPTVELTHAVISKIQKHCRFAISSLDYEDAEQARKELLAALALLGE